MERVRSTVHSSAGFGMKWLTEIAQKYALIHHATPSDDQVNAEIVPEINESATQISVIVLRRPI